MRILCLFFFTIILFSCTNDAKKISKPSFLIGNWKRLNDKPNHQTFETWNTNFTGFGYTKKGGETTFSEQLSIVTINDTLHLKVVGVNEKPTLFKFTNQTDSSFVAENPKHDFPKKITYFKENNQLKAIVEADDFRIDFVFKKVE